MNNEQLRCASSVCASFLRVPTRLPSSLSLWLFITIPNVLFFHHPFLLLWLHPLFSPSFLSKCLTLPPASSTQTITILCRSWRASFILSAFFASNFRLVFWNDAKLDENETTSLASTVFVARLHSSTWVNQSYFKWVFVLNQNAECNLKDWLGLVSYTNSKCVGAPILLPSHRETGPAKTTQIPI